MLPLILRPKGLSYPQRILKLSPLNYYTFGEAGGVTANNLGSVGAPGNLTYTGATLAQMPAPGGTLAPLFDGVNDCMNCFAPDLSKATVSFYAKVLDASCWSDGANRKAISWSNGSGLYIDVRLATNAVVFYFVSNAKSFSTTTLSWFHAAFTWSQASNYARMYLNGVQVGTDMAWADLGSSGYRSIAKSGAGNFEYWKGYLAHVAYWNSALTPAQIASLYIGD
jgi:hypothetical protein